MEIKYSVKIVFLESFFDFGWQMFMLVTDAILHL